MLVSIRSSSISSIIDCPSRGLSIMLGLIKQLPSTAPAAIGTACHEGTAMYDKHRMKGEDFKPDDAADVVVDNIWHPKDEVNWGRITQKEAERRALGVYTRYCTDIAPQIKYEAVELPLTPFTININGVEIELTGTLDRIYTQWTPVDESTERLTGRGILDIKTGVNACSAKPEKHIAQIGTYELLATMTENKEITLPGLIGQLQTSNEYQVGVAPVHNARTVLLGTPEQTGLLGHIATMIKTGDWPGNVSSWLCSEKYCPLYNKCFFRGKI